MFYEMEIEFQERNSDGEGSCARRKEEIPRLCKCAGEDLLLARRHRASLAETGSCLKNRPGGLSPSRTVIL